MSIERIYYQTDEKRLIKDALNNFYGIKSEIHNMNRKVRNKPDYCKCIKRCKEVLNITSDKNIVSLIYCLMSKAYQCLNYAYLAIKYSHLAIQNAITEGVMLFAEKTLAENLLLIPMFEGDAYKYFQKSIQSCLENGNLKELVKLYLTRGELMGIEQDLINAVEICEAMYEDEKITYSMLLRAIGTLNRFYEKQNTIPIKYYKFEEYGFAN